MLLVTHLPPKHWPLSTKNERGVEIFAVVFTSSMKEGKEKECHHGGKVGRR